MKNYQKIRVSDRHLFYVTTFKRSTQMTIFGLLYHPNKQEALPKKYG